MVIGADKMSSILDMQDRNTCVLFGDGAGGVLLERSEDPSLGLVDFEHFSDGSNVDCLNVRGGGSAHTATHETVDKRLHYVRQDGRAVFKFAVVKMAEISATVLERNGLTGQDLALFVPHQANRRIIDAAAERMSLPADRVMVNIDRFANTTAGTIPIALSQACAEDRLKRAIFIDDGRWCRSDLGQCTFSLGRLACLILPLFFQDKLLSCGYGARPARSARRSADLFARADSAGFELSAVCFVDLKSSWRKRLSRSPQSLCTASPHTNCWQIRDNPSVVAGHSWESIQHCRCGRARL